MILSSAKNCKLNFGCPIDENRKKGKVVLNSLQFLNLTRTELRKALNENAYRKDDESRRWFSRFKFAHDSVNGNPHTALAQGLDLLNR